MDSKLYLNHLEIKIISDQIKSNVCNTTIERIIIPQRPFSQKGYFHHEWVIRLKSKKTNLKECALLYSTQNAHPYISFYSQKGPKAHEKASQSSFLQELSKILKGTKITDYYCILNERITCLECLDTKNNASYTLITELIPAKPNAFLVNKVGSEFKVLIQERGVIKTYNFPKAQNQSKKYTIRSELVSHLKTYTDKIETGLKAIEHTKKVQNLLKIYTQKKTHLEKHIKKYKKTLELTKQEPNWGEYGLLLKSNLHQLKTAKDGQRLVFDYSSNKEVLIPALKGKEPRDEIEAFFKKEKRKKRKIIETTEYLSDLEKQYTPFTLFPNALELKDLSFLELNELENKFNPQQNTTSTQKFKELSFGKSFISREGHRIIVGRKKEENHKVTFQLAKGNDIWMHARGKPSAHVIIQLAKGKSASLETLIDAATLLIYFSKGTSWGKTEVDYTLKKYVKKIKNSDQVSYTQNKTLLLEFDPARLDKIHNL